MKIIQKSNFRIVIEPTSLGNFGSIRVSDTFFGASQEQIEKDYMQRCKQIEEDVKRHVDNIGYTRIEFDTEEICSLCGYGWELDEETGEPTCCQKAIDEFISTQPQTA